MIRNLRMIVLILIILTGLISIYLSVKKIQLIQTSCISDSFCFSSKHGDTVFIDYPIDTSEVKDILFTVDDYTYGRGLSVFSIKKGEQAFGREFVIKDSIIIYKGHEIFPGDSFGDTLTFNSKRNLFQIVSDRFKFKNEGFIKVAILRSSIFDLKGKKLDLIKPTILVTGSCEDIFSLNRKVLFIYYILIFLLIFLGILFLYLQYVIKTNKHRHQQQNTRKSGFGASLT